MKKNIPFGFPIVGDSEKNEVKKVLNGYIFAHGSRIKKFEKDFSSFTHSPYSISVSSCTTGMHLIYEALNIKKGDEVILPAQTHVATAHAIEHCGAKPIFVDCDPVTGNIDPNKIIKKISKRTKAITVVHFLGLPVNFIEIKKIAKKYNLIFIEDAAHAFGGTYKGKYLGTLGDIGIFSLHPRKNFHVLGDGGLIVTNNKKLYQKISDLLNKYYK